MVVTAALLLKTIRKHCLECCSGSAQDVKNCTAGPDAAPHTTCALWTFRLGVNPDISDAKREAGRKAYYKNLSKASQQEPILS